MKTTSSTCLHCSSTSLIALALGFTLCWGSPLAARAAVRTWTGAGADNLWATSANWDSGSPVNNDSVLFGALTRPANTNNITGLVLSGLSFNASGFAIGGNAITNTGGAYDAAGNNTNYTISHLAAPQAFTNMTTQTRLVFAANITNYGNTLSIGGDGAVWLNGILGGTTGASTNSGGLVMNGGSILRLAGANNFVGGLTINAGQADLANGAAIPSGAGRGDVTINSGTLNLNGNNQTINGLYGSGSAFVDVTNVTGTYTLTIGNNATNSAGNWSGSILNSYGGVINVSKINTNTLTFNSAQNYSGSTTINAGTLALAGFGSIGNSPSILVNPGGVFDVSGVMGGFTLGSFGSQMLTAGRATNDGPADIVGVFAEGLSGSISVYRAGTPGTLTFSSDLSLTGGTLNLDLADTTTAGSGVNDLIVLNGTLTLSGTTTVLPNPVNGVFGVGTYTLISNQTATAVSGGPGNLTVSAPRGMTATFDTTSKPGSLLMNLSGAAAPASLVWQGSTSTDWDVKATRNWLNGASADYFYNLDNVVFNDAGVGTVNLPIGVSPTTAVFNNVATNYALSGAGAITGPGSLTVQGGGTVTLNTANKYTGDTAVNNGSTLILGVLPAAPHIAVYNGVSLGDLNLGGGSLFMSDNANDTYRANFNDLVLNPGAASVAMRNRQSSSSYIYQFNSVLRSGPGGTVDFNNIQSKASSPQVGLLVTNTATLNGILGGFATIFEADWVVPVATGGGSTALPAASYTTTNNPAYWFDTNNIFASAAPSANLDDTIINSLKLAGSTATLNAGRTLSLLTGGLLMPSGGAAAAIVGGTLLGATNADLIVHQHSAASALTIGSVIADNTNSAATSGSVLTKSGQGTLILTGANTYTGPTYINGTTLSAANNNTPGRFPAGTLQLGNGGTSGSIDNSPAVINNANLAFNRSDAITFGLPISGKGALKVLGGNVALTGANTYSGATTISAGTLQVGNGGTSGTLGSSRSVANNGTLVFNRSDNLTFAGPISGTGSVVQQGAGQTTLGGANTYGGNTLVNAGILALGASGSLSNSPAIVVAQGTKFDVSAVTGGFALNGGTVNQVLAGTGTVAGDLSMPAGVRITPATNGVAGTLAFSGALSLNGGTVNLDLSSNATDLVTVSGNLNLNAGIIQLNLTGTLGAGTYKLMQYGGTLGGSVNNITVAGFNQPGYVAELSAGSGEVDLVVTVFVAANLTWVGNGGNNFWDVNATADWSGGAKFRQNDNVTFDDSSVNTMVNLVGGLTPGTVTVNAAVNSYTWQGSGQIAGGTVTKNNIGTLTILTTNTYSGPTVIDGGAVQLGNGVAGGNFGNGSVTVGSLGAAVFNEPGDTLVSCSFDGSGPITQQGSGSVTLVGNNTFTGPLTIASGLVTVGVGGLAGTLGAGPITNNSSIVINRAGTLAVSGGIAGSGGLTNVGSGTVILSGNNTFTGNTVVQSGTLKLGAREVIPDGLLAGNVVLDGGAAAAGTLDLNGFNESINGLSGATSNVVGVVANNAGTLTNYLTVGGNDASSSFLGKIVDNTGTGGKLALIKVGTGTLTLDPPAPPAGVGNTYSGGTIISNGVVSGGNSTTANSYMLGTGPVTFYGTDGVLQMGGWTGSTTPDYGTLANPIVLTPNASATVLGSCRAGGGFAPASVTGPASSTLTYATRYVRGNFGGNWTGFNGLLVVSNNTASGNNDFRLNTAAGLPNARVHLAVGGGGGAYVYNLVTGTPIIPIGELTGEATTTIALNSGNSGGQPALWSVGGLNTSVQFDGDITDTHGIIKVGTGTWTLTSSNLTFSGPTTVSNGTLAFSATAALPPSSTYTVVAPGRLDVSAAGTLTLGSGQTLTGNGNIQGNVDVAGTNAPGNPIGPLTVGGTATLSGVTIMELNRTNNPATNDMLVASSITAGGQLTVTNVGPVLVAGDTFKLFSTAVSGFSTVTLPAADSGFVYTWTNKLAVDGSIALLSVSTTISTTPTNIVAVSVGGLYQISWPADMTGWELLTNAAGLGIASAWYPYPGSTLTNQLFVPIGTTTNVFFRLHYQYTP